MRTDARPICRIITGELTGDSSCILSLTGKALQYDARLAQNPTTAGTFARTILVHLRQILCEHDELDTADGSWFA